MEGIHSIVCFWCRYLYGNVIPCTCSFLSFNNTPVVLFFCLLVALLYNGAELCMGLKLNIAPGKPCHYLGGDGKSCATEGPWSYVSGFRSNYSVVHGMSACTQDLSTPTHSRGFLRLFTRLIELYGGQRVLGRYIAMSQGT